MKKRKYRRSADEIDIFEPINRRKLIIMSLFLIILLYESETGAFIESVKMRRPQTASPENATDLEKHVCDRKVALAEYDQLPIVFLNSFPGSGIT